MAVMTGRLLMLLELLLLLMKMLLLLLLLMLTMLLLLLLLAVLVRLRQPMMATATMSIKQCAQRLISHRVRYAGILTRRQTG